MWSDWIDEACSKTCDNGVRTRYRSCVGPYCEGQECNGIEEVVVRCNEGTCQGRTFIVIALWVTVAWQYRNAQDVFFRYLLVGAHLAFYTRILQINEWPYSKRLKIICIQQQNIILSIIQSVINIKAFWITMKIYHGSDHEVCMEYLGTHQTHYRSSTHIKTA